jgi:pyruvate-formate lyase-activating enzyme
MVSRLQAFLGISRPAPLIKSMSPEQVVAAAVENNGQTIAFMYTEPTTFLEYAHDKA